MRHIKSGCQIKNINFLDILIEKNINFLDIRIETTTTTTTKRKKVRRKNERKTRKQIRTGSHRRGGYQMVQISSK